MKPTSRNHSTLPVASLLLIVTLLGSAFLVGCDTNDNDDGDFDAVAGEYRFTEFDFTPASNLLEPVDLLDTLVVDNTRLQLFNSGRFTLLYQFVSGESEFVGGDFSVNDRRVRLNGANDENEFYESLLLSNETTLQRIENQVLFSEVEKVVDLAAFSDRYRGLPSVEGTLVLRLQPITN